MWKTAEGSTGRLIQLCIGLFSFYVITGVTVRYFQYYPKGPQFNSVEYLLYSTLGGVTIALAVVIFKRWYRFKSACKVKFLGINMPCEFFYIIPSGACTAIIITFTTLMYSIRDVSVMVAMVLMRASIIIISRIVDSIQIKQGILHKKVYFQENMGVLFALLAISVKMFYSVIFKSSGSEFDFLTHPIAMTILSCYVGAYAIRIYIMNYFKNTRPKHMIYDNKEYFAIEQISATVTLLIAGLILFFIPVGFGGGNPEVQIFRGAITHAKPMWNWAIFAGTAFGIVSFFSVFVFMFKGRTATFVGLVNRLTTLIAGTAATIICWLFLQGEFPKTDDWISLLFILVAIGFISLAEKRRVKELAVTHEVELSPEEVTK